MAEGADFGPLWIRADEQTGGLGRSGRSWISPKGNLYASHLFAVDMPMNRFADYSFVAALAVSDCLSTIYPKGEFGLKWPNDVLLGRAKISGLLLETGKTRNQSWIIIGIGINLASHPSGTPYPATSLASHMTTVPGPETVMEILADRFAHWCDRYERGGFEPVRQNWLSRAVNIPGPVTVRLPHESFDGQAINMNATGALQVRLSDGTIRNVHAGDIYLG